MRKKGYVGLFLFFMLLSLFSFSHLEGENKQTQAEKEEQAKIAQEAKVMKQQEDLAFRQAQSKARQEEQARQKAEQDRQRQIKEAERKAENARLAQEKEAKARQLAAEKAQKEEQAKAEKARLAQEKEFKAKQAAEEKARKEYRTRIEKETKARQLAAEKAQKEEQERLAQEARQEEARIKEREKQRKIAAEKIQKEQTARIKEEERIRLKIEQEKQRQAKEAERQIKEAQFKAEKARKEYQARIEKETKARQLAAEKAQKEEQARIKEQQRLNKLAAEKAQREQAEKAHQEGQARQRAEQEKLRQEKEVKRQADELKRAQQAQDRREEFAKQAAQRKAEQDRQRQIKEAQFKAENARLAQEKEAKARQLAAEKAQKEEQAKAEKARLAQEKEFKAKQAAEEKARKEYRTRIEKETKARQLAQEKAQKEEQAKAEKARLAQEKEAKAKQAAEEKARKEYQARIEKETKARQLAAEKAQKEEQARIKEQQRLNKLAAEKAQREQAEKAKKEEQSRLKAEQERQRQIKEAELRAEKTRLAQEREAKAKQLAQENAQKEEQEKIEREAVARKKQIKLAQEAQEQKVKPSVSVKSVTEEKALSEAMFAKQQEDQAKIVKIENLWQDARRFYAKGMYEEAIRAFQKIIELEGNPRIKYTPAAKEYIEKAKEKMADKKQADLFKEVEAKEKDMMNEVYKQQLPPYLEPPERIEETKESPLVEPPLIRKKLKKTVTLDFDKVSLESVLAFLSQDTGVNFVTSQRVLDANFNVTTRFQQAPVEDVVKYITKSLGLIYRIDKDIIWIAHPEEIAAETPETRVYYLSKGGGLFTEFSPISGGSSETGLGSSSAQVTKVYTIEDTLKEIVPWPADSKLYYDKRINALIIRNTPQNLQMLEDLLYNMDVTPIQVLIEARFLEVDITDTKELGITWGITGGDYAMKKKADGSLKEGIGKDSGVDFSSFTKATEGFNLTYKGMITNSQLQAVIHAMEESKKIKTLSSPRITTLNNQMATMKVVDEWIYPTRYEFEILQVPGQLPSQTPTYEYKNVPKDFQRRDVGILLKVIPSVGADRKTISLSLIPEVSEATADAFVYTGDVKLPKFTSRNLSTTIVANSGDTVVLGGMIKENRTKTITKVPILGDIPLLGVFFKKNADVVERKNLIIFVTAKILSPSGEEVIIAQK